MRADNWVYWCIGGGAILSGAAIGLLRLDPNLPRYAQAFGSALAGFALTLFLKAIFPNVEPVAFIAGGIFLPFPGLPLLIGVRSIALKFQADPIGAIQELWSWRKKNVD